MGTYAEFLERKAQLDGMAGFEPLWLPDFLFGFQRMLADWSIRQGCDALLVDCGLGKGPMALVWAQNVYKHTGKPVLLLTRLGVTGQMETEGAKFGIDAEISRDGRIPAGVTVANYERLEHFDPAKFGGVVCDESSAIKAYDGVRKAMVTEFARTMPYRLLATATAAPNDWTELGTSSEALGYLGYQDMLSMFFTNKDKTSKSMGGKWRPRAGEEWRFKGHAEVPFWRSRRTVAILRTASDGTGCGGNGTRTMQSIARSSRRQFAPKIPHASATTGCAGSSESARPSMTSCLLAKTAAAPSAVPLSATAQGEGTISITATRPALFEGFSAQSAISALASSETTWTYFSARSTTSRAITVRIDPWVTS